VLLRDPETYIRSVRRQLGLVEAHAAKTIEAIRQQLRTPDLLPSTRARCQALIGAARDQSEDILAILRPLVGHSEPATASTEPPAPLQYIHYLYRDWGWSDEPDGENQHALEAVKSVLNGHVLGRMLVVGAGACRLAYDLHCLTPDCETVAVDIDAFLLATAQRVLRGESLIVREANAEVHELGAVVKEWRLQARHGRIDETRFHLLIADGLEPPFASESFDTVVTPWFIDVVPPDLRNFMSEIHRLLRQGGLWLNLGPLRYRHDIPVTRRFAREEVFDLAGGAGFQVEKAQAESVPYLVSKLNGRGKMEWVLSFSARKLATSGGTAGTDGPPPWLLFRHIPVPVFDGLSAFQTEDPAEQIVADAIDGKNTLDDIASTLASSAGETSLSMDQFREIVRRCLAVIHPLV
jgi:SAM-dependent methyltransferase